MLRLDGTVAVTQFLEITASLLEHAATDFTQPFKTVVVGTVWKGRVHGADSMSSRGVIICGVCSPRVLLMR